MLHSYFDDAPQYVNGQRVSCTLDGMAVGCSQAYHMLDVGSAIPAFLEPFQNSLGFSFTSHGLGIFTWEYYVPGNDENIPLPPIDQVTRGHWEQGAYFFPVSWSPQWQTQQQQSLTIKDIIDEAKRVIGDTPSCRDIFASDVDPIKLLEDFEKGTIGNITFGTLTSRPGFTTRATTVPALGPGIPLFTDTGMPVFQNGKQLKQSVGFTNVNITLNTILGSPGGERYGLNTLQDRVVTLIHELGHAANFIRNNFANAKASASAILDDDPKRPEVSINNSDFVWANCFGPLSRLTQTGVIQ